MNGDLLKTLSLFEGSDLIFISYGEEEGGEYRPHTRAVRVKPTKEYLEEAIENTPLLPNDFGIMPFKWKARSEEDIGHLLLERKLFRWTEGELFAHGEVVIDRVLLDIDDPEADLEGLSKLGVGKVGWTGGGYLAVVELNQGIRVKDRELYRRIRDNLVKGLKGKGFRFDEGSLNLGKGVRLIGTFSRKRGVQTKWVLWEEGRAFDVYELIFGVKEQDLARAPEPLRRGLSERFGIEIRGGGRKATEEDLFLLAREFYGEIDGRRNEFMLLLSGELLAKGVPYERAVELYYEHLADLEKRDRPHRRIKQTIEWVYKEGKEYRFHGEWLEGKFGEAVRSFRGEEVSLGWKEFAELVGHERFEKLLRLAGEKVYEDSGEFFHINSGYIRGKFKGKEGIKEVSLFLELFPCLKSALSDYERALGEEAQWYLNNLLEVSYFMPPVSDVLENPYVKAVVLVSCGKGLRREEIVPERAKRRVGGADAGVLNLIRCLNPLLRERCDKGCRWAEFLGSLPEVKEREVDLRTGKVVRAFLKVEGKEFEVSGRVLENVKSLGSFLEKRGHLLPPLAVRWLYAGIMKGACRYVEAKREEFKQRLGEILQEFGDQYVERFDGKNLWIGGRSFVDLLKEAGLSVKGVNIKEVRKLCGFGFVRERARNYTLIPLDFFGEEDKEGILERVLRSYGSYLEAEGVEVEIKKSVGEEDELDEDYVLGRKAYLLATEEGVEVRFCGRSEKVQDPARLRSFILSVKKDLNDVEVEL